MESKRRAWVKNAAIIFLAVMLILTFFSNTIMNRSLTEVAAQYAQSGSITAKIRTSATVAANSKYDIKIDETRTVKGVAVQEGQEVQIGDVLFYLDDAESAELAGARETLAQLEREYELKLLTLDEDFYADEVALREKRQQLAKAEALLAGIADSKARIDEIEASIKQLTAEQKELTKQISTYQSEIGKLEGGAASSLLTDPATSERLAAAQEKYDALKAEYNSAKSALESADSYLKAAENTYQTALKKYNAAVPEGSVDIESLAEDIAELEKSMRRAKEDFDREYYKHDEELEDLYEKYDRAYRRYMDAISDLDGAKNEAQENKFYEDAIYWRTEAERLYEEYEAMCENVDPQKESLKLTYDRQYEDNSARLKKLKAQYEALEGSVALKTALDRAAAVRDDRQIDSDAAEKAYTEIEGKYAEAQKELDAISKLSLIEGYEVTLESLEAQNEVYTEQLAELKAELEKLSAAVDEEAQRETITSLKDEIVSMQHALTRRREQAAIDDKREALEIEDLLSDIEEQKALIAKYEANSTDAKICATVAGQVSSLSVSAGMETSMGQTLCQIIVTELGYSCEISLTAEQARRVRVGDTVEVTNSWWSNISGTIINIRNDPKNPGNTKLATISLTGDVTVGQNLALTIGEKGQTYDAVVPNSAIREDNNGKFVLVIEAKSSPLGNRYIARRYDVEVLASDDTNSAVSGLIGSEFIITTSAAPISAGEQVRMAEN